MVIMAISFADILLVRDDGNIHKSGPFERCHYPFRIVPMIVPITISFETIHDAIDDTISFEQYFVIAVYTTMV